VRKGYTLTFEERATCPTTCRHWRSCHGIEVMQQFARVQQGNRGVWNPDALRNDAKAIGFVQEAAAAGKIVAAVCHGPWVLSDAGLTRGKRATGWWSIKSDSENAGATYIDEPAVTDGKIVTARAPIDLAGFVHAIDHLLVAA
jgi:deglycase